MKICDVLILENDNEYIDGILENLQESQEDLGFQIIPWCYISKKHFDDESGLALDALVMEIVCVDFHLPGGINGNEIIKQIRSHEANKSIPIIFYSALQNEAELKSILEEDLIELSQIYFAQKDTLEDRIINLLS